MKTSAPLAALALLWLSAMASLAGSFIQDVNGAVVWDNKPETGGKAEWVGPVDKTTKKANGAGKIIWMTDTGRLSVTYYGTMQDGRLSGLVLGKDASGNYSRGSWVNGQRGADWKPAKDSKTKQTIAREIAAREANLNQANSDDQPAEPNAKPDKIIATRKSAGTFLGFQAGDYIYAIILSGKTKDSYMLEPGMEYFLAPYQGKEVTFTYQLVDAWLPEAGDMVRVKRIKAITANKIDFAFWWDKVTGGSSIQELQERYGKAVEKATLAQ